jgi:hypothetical protein
MVAKAPFLDFLIFKLKLNIAIFNMAAKAVILSFKLS